MKKWSKKRAKRNRHVWRSRGQLRYDAFAKVAMHAWMQAAKNQRVTIKRGEHVDP